MRKIIVLTLFPELFSSFFENSILLRAQEKGLVSLSAKNIRDFGVGKLKQVDDYAFGGGAGMILMVKPVVEAIETAKKELNNPLVILLSPQGVVYNQAKALSIAQQEQDIIFICGHYEGFDERIRNFVNVEISLGDFVLTGGEIAAIALVDSIVRLIPGVINPESLENESFSSNPNLLDYPVYTRPREFQGLVVPETLISGNHKLIKEWRHRKSLEKTKLNRPDLYQNYISKIKKQH